MTVQHSRQWNDEELKILNEYSKLEGFTINNKQEQNKISNKHFFKGVNPTKFFDYHYYANKEKRKLFGLIYFGTHVGNHLQIVHGGAIATALDSLMGECMRASGHTGVTVNLNVDYKKAITIETTLRVEACLQRIEGRKMFLNAKLKDLKGEVLHSEANAIFIKIQM